MIRTIAGAFNSESTFQQGSWGYGADNINVLHDPGRATSIVSNADLRSGRGGGSGGAGASFDTSLGTAPQLTAGATFQMTDSNGNTMSYTVDDYTSSVVPRTRPFRPPSKPKPPVTTTTTTTTTSSTTTSSTTTPPPTTTSSTTTSSTTTSSTTTTTSTTTPPPTTPPPTTPPPTTTVAPTTTLPPPTTTTPP